MRWLIATALRQRVAVVAVTALLLILGLWTVGDAPLDVFPEFAPPQVEIQTEAPGLSTEGRQTRFRVTGERTCSSRGSSWPSAWRGWRRSCRGWRDRP